MFFKVDVSHDLKLNVVKDDVKHNEVKHVIKPYEVNNDVKPVFVEIDVGQRFKNEPQLTAREHMLQWVNMVASNLGFGIVIGRSNNGLNKRQPFVTMRCERNDTYVPPIRKLKWDYFEMKNVITRLNCADIVRWIKCGNLM